MKGELSSNERESIREMHLERINQKVKDNQLKARVACMFIGLLLVALIAALLISHYTSYNNFDIVIYICAGALCVAFVLFLLFKGSEAPFFVKQMMGGVFPCECAVTAVLHFLTYMCYRPFHFHCGSFWGIHKGRVLQVN